MRTVAVGRGGLPRTVRGQYVCIRHEAAAVCGVVLQAIDWLFFAGVSATLVLYPIVNFHHSIVDALIWKTHRSAPAPVATHAS